MSGKKYSTEKFIEKAKQVHGDKYDYSKVIYNGAMEKVCIICPIHGEFWQTPNSHLSGYGCRLCGLRSTKFKNDFFKRAIMVHGDKYDYSKTIVKDSLSKVDIICRKHGVFSIRAFLHLQGQGCPRCFAESVGDRKRMKWEEFVKRAKEKHGDKYIYNKEDFVNATTKIKILCKIHGLFEQTPSRHLTGEGCPQCVHDNMWDVYRHKKTTREFIDEAIAIHGDLYDYSKTEYEHSLKKVCITCKKHGDFWITPSEHLRGHGCPYCSLSKGEEKIEKFLREHDVCHERQYEIHYKTLLCQQSKIKVDFYIPSHNTFIEYNGQQHYNPIEKWGGQKELEKQQARDMALRQYCNEHKIKLIEIPYTEFNNINNILAKELKFK